MGSRGSAESALYDQQLQMSKDKVTVCNDSTLQMQKRSDAGRMFEKLEKLGRSECGRSFFCLSIIHSINVIFRLILLFLLSGAPEREIGGSGGRLNY